MKIVSHNLDIGCQRCIMVHTGGKALRNNTYYLAMAVFFDGGTPIRQIERNAVARSTLSRAKDYGNGPGATFKGHCWSKWET